MAKFSQKLMGAEVGSAAVYAEPHTMSGGKVSLKNSGYDGGNRMTTNDLRVSVGGIASRAYDEPKTAGVKTRGNGCATKGTMARGPMA